MDLTPSEAQQHTASSSIVPPLQPQDSPSPEDLSPSTSSRTLRSSSRAKTVKEKGKQVEFSETPQETTRVTRSSNQTSKRPRDQQGKGKAKQTEDPAAQRPLKKFVLDKSHHACNMSHLILSLLEPVARHSLSRPPDLPSSNRLATPKARNAPHRKLPQTTTSLPPQSQSAQRSPILTALTPSAPALILTLTCLRKTRTCPAYSPRCFSSRAACTIIFSLKREYPLSCVAQSH
jgi:hypothetical protein